MNRNEKDEIRNLPAQYRPLTAWEYFGYSVLFAIPLLGFIFLVIFSLSSSNINRRSFARSYFCVLILVAVIFVIALASGLGTALIGFIGSMNA